MAVEVSKTYLLAEFSIEPGKRQLRRGTLELHLASRPFQVLLYLIEHRDRLVTRTELLELFWQGKDVYDETLTKCVGAIRKSLDDRLDKPRFIETRYAEGYRYVGPLGDQFVPTSPSALEIERTRVVKIVVEEEEIQETEDENAQAPSVQTHIAPLGLSAPKSSRRIAVVALGLICLVLTASALISYRIRARASLASHTIVPPLLPVNSIAVLPLKNLSGDPAQEYFSDGLTESFISELSRIKGLKVISRSSVFTFKGKEVDPREVGQKLGVAAVLEGSVRKSDSNVRVEVRLISTQDGRVLWTSDTYDHTLKDIFAIQDGIACSVVAELRVRLCGEGDAFKQHTNNVEAYQAYLKGRYFINAQYSEVGPVKALNQAAGYFEQAIALDPHYALGYAGLADAYTQLFWFSTGDPRPMIAKAKAAALKAVELDGTLTETHTALSAAYLHDWNFDGAGREIEQALALNPGYAWAHHEHATYLGTVGRGDPLAEMKKAEELDPLNIAIIVDTGNTFLSVGKYDEAIAQFRKAREIDPNAINGANIGSWYVDNGRYEEGIKEIEAAIATKGRTPDLLMSLAIGYAKAGKKEKAARLLDEMKRLSKKQYVPNTFFAFVYAALGEKDQAFEYLERAYREHDINLLQIKGLRLEPLRSDPRFTDLLRRVGV